MRMKFIPGKDGEYSITDDGRVWCHGYTIKVKSRWGTWCEKTYKPHWVATNGSKDGKWYISVAIGKKHRKGYKIHRLMAQAFIPNPKNLPEVNHKNGDKTDNRLENLEWCTHQENIDHSWVVSPHRKHKPLKGTSNPNHKLSEVQVREIRKRHANGECLLRMEKEYPVTRTMLRFIVQRKSWKHIK